MPNIYAGKASSIEYAASDSWPGTDLGEMKSVKIGFEPELFEGLANDHPVGGYGTFEAELAEADAAKRTTLEALINADTYFRITSTTGKTYIVHGPVTLAETRDYSDPQNPHIYKIMVKRYCNIAGDFCAAPTDT